MLIIAGLPVPGQMYRFFCAFMFKRTLAWGLPGSPDHVHSCPSALMLPEIMMPHIRNLIISKETPFLVMENGLQSFSYQIIG
jgi:hypothetical protein